MRVNILSIGKNKEKWLEEAIALYSKRLAPKTTLSFHLMKSDQELEKKLEKQSYVIGLDPKGIMLSSLEFSHWLQKRLLHTSYLTFIIGGARGLTQQMKANTHELLSLSPMTFTHQMSRLILIEQLYRAFEIQSHSPYHK